MNKYVVRVREHVERNKKVYSVGGVCLLIGAAGGLVLASRQGAVNNKITQVLSYKPEATLEVFIEALGDPGNIIQETSTGTIYASQGQAARELGLSPAAISKHLNGASPHVNGHTFTKLGKAAVA
jgi:hypothetical protein